jgi:hypothetical protein
MSHVITPNLHNRDLIRVLEVVSVVYVKLLLFTEKELSIENRTPHKSIIIIRLSYNVLTIMIKPTF